MKIKFLIPSYKRVNKQLTLDYLLGLGYLPEDIYISTQTEDDYKAYLPIYKDKCTLCYEKGNNVSDNRNTLLKQIKAGERVVMMDDDIKSIDKLVGKSLEPITTKNELDRFIKSAFEYTEMHNGVIWGVYPINNPFFMSNKIDDTKLLIGTVLGIIYDGEIFDKEFSVKEDYELCCRMFKKGKKVIRFNQYSANALHKSKGGCEENWKDEKNYIYAEKLVSKYPRIVRLNSKKKGEIQCLMKAKKFN